MKDVGGYGKIDFAIKIRSNNQNGMVTATLQLLETIDRANGYYQNTNTASIANYTAKESNNFIVDMLKHFNVVSKKEEGFLKKDKVEEDVDLIIARKKYEDLLRKGSEEKIDAAFKSLYEKRLKLLARSEAGKKILAEFNNEAYKINGWFIKEGMPGYYKYLNQVLDGLFEVHSEEVLQDVALTAAWRKSAEVMSSDMAKILSNANVAISRLNDETMNNERIEANKQQMSTGENMEEKQQPEKAPGAAKAEAPAKSAPVSEQKQEQPKPAEQPKQEQPKPVEQPKKEQKQNDKNNTKEMLSVFAKLGNNSAAYTEKENNKTSMDEAARSASTYNEEKVKPKEEELGLGE